MESRNVVILSADCEHSKTFVERFSNLLKLHDFRVIVYDSKNRLACRDLLWAMRIDKLPAMMKDGNVMTGADAFSCATNMASGRMMHTTIYHSHDPSS